eukprot:403348542
MSQSIFTSYSTNVNKIFDEYSVENMKAQLNQQSQNEIQLSSSEFKDMLSKVTRMLEPHIEDEEASLIDIQTYLVGPQNRQVDPQNRQPKVMKQVIQKPPLDCHNEIDNQLSYDQFIKKMKESQAQMREEFKYSLNAFEVNQNQVNQSLQQQIDHRIKVAEDKQQKDLNELQKEIQSNLQERFIAVDQIKIQLNQQNQFRIQSDHQLQNLSAIVETIKQKLEQQIKDLSAKQLETKDLQDFRARIESANLKFEQDLQSSKFVQNAFELKVQRLEQELNSIKVSYQKQLKQSLNDFDQLESKLKNMIKQEFKINNTQMMKEVKYILELENHKNQSSKSLNRSYILEQEEQKQSQVMGNQIIAIVQVPSVEECMKLSNQLKKKLFRDLVDKEINKSQHSLLQQQISYYSTKQYKLLYCGSRDGFSAYKFYSLCYNKGPTVSFILSECGQVFGGYASLPWTTSNHFLPDIDLSAFVFSLSKRSIHRQNRKQHQAVYHCQDYMCAFGNDIEIGDNCDKNSNSWCNLGCTYELPNGYQYSSNEAQSYLAGQYHFKVLEIQVYSLQ